MNLPRKPSLNHVYVPQSLAWSQFVELGATERHFNTLQYRYRAMASTWLLATFAGIGFVMANKAKFPGGRYPMVACVGAAGALGIGLLWSIDLLVYTKLLDAAFDEGRDLENYHKFLPRLHTRMKRVVDDQRVQKRCARFYLSGIAVLLAVGGAALSVEARNTLWALILIPTLSVFIIANILAYMWRITLGRNWRNFTARASKEIKHPNNSIFDLLVNTGSLQSWAGLDVEDRDGSIGEGWGAVWHLTGDREGAIRKITYYDRPSRLTVRLERDDEAAKKANASGKVYFDASGEAHVVVSGPGRFKASGEAPFKVSGPIDPTTSGPTPSKASGKTYFNASGSGDFGASGPGPSKVSGKVVATLEGQGDVKRGPARSKSFPFQRTYHLIEIENGAATRLEIEEFSIAYGIRAFLIVMDPLLIASRLRPKWCFRGRRKEIEQDLDKLSSQLNEKRDRLLSEQKS